MDRPLRCTSNASVLNKSAIRRDLKKRMIEHARLVRAFNDKSSSKQLREFCEKNISKLEERITTLRGLLSR